MTCFRPLTAWRGPVLPSGKRGMVFNQKEASPAFSLNPDHLPCGQCFGCRIDYSCDWAMRCDKEIQMNERNCFITLSYASEFLPADSSLCLDDWQLFMKRLRKKVGNVRYFHAGEYGGRFGRPHDHALLFGYDFPDRVRLKKTPAGQWIDTSEMLSKLWGKGYCSVGNATFESAAYVARYCMKKINGKALEVRDACGLLPYERITDDLRLVELRHEYVTMSRRPGVGRSWFDKFYKDVYPHDYVICRGGVKLPPPRIFDVWFERMNKSCMDDVKVRRIARCNQKEEVWNDVLKKMQWLDVARDERLMVMEEFMKSKYKMYSRSLEV